MEITEAYSAEKIEMIRELFTEYVSFLNVDLDFQGFNSELKNLPGRYAPPEGALFIAMENDYPTGCCALKKITVNNEICCEMKRLYVRPDARGNGTGKKLALIVIEKAVKLGYKTMYLDTLERLETAVRMYSTMGFEKTEPYYSNPIPDAVYWKLDLSKFI